MAAALALPILGVGSARADIAQVNLSVSNDYTNEKWVDLDADGRSDVKLELIRLEHETLMGKHSVEILLRATTRMHASVASGAPLREDELISNFLNFGRSTTLIYYNRQADTERHGGDWFKDQDTHLAFLPVRLRVAQGIRLGWIEIEFDGYGSARILRYGLGKEIGETVLAGAITGDMPLKERDCDGACKTDFGDTGKPMRLALNE